jgi:peptidyl-tRNA hydrolase
MAERDPDPYVLYFVVRTDLKMGGGKVSAQTGHAIHYLLVDAMNERWPTRDEVALRSKHMMRRETMTAEDWERFEALGAESKAHADRAEHFRTWARSVDHAIVTLGANDEEFEIVKSENPYHFKTVDHGYTQVDAMTETCLALWPMRKSARSPILKRLRLLP